MIQSLANEEAHLHTAEKSNIVVRVVTIDDPEIVRLFDRAEPVPRPDDTIGIYPPVERQLRVDEVHSLLGNTELLPLTRILIEAVGQGRVSVERAHLWLVIMFLDHIREYDVEMYSFLVELLRKMRRPREPCAGTGRFLRNKAREFGLIINEL